MKMKTILASHFLILSLVENTLNYSFKIKARITYYLWTK